VVFIRLRSSSTSLESVSILRPVPPTSESGAVHRKPSGSAYSRAERAPRVSSISLPSLVAANLTWAAPLYNSVKWNNDPNIRREDNRYHYPNTKFIDLIAWPSRGNREVRTLLLACAFLGQVRLLELVFSTSGDDVGGGVALCRYFEEMIDDGAVRSKIGI